MLKQGKVFRPVIFPHPAAVFVKGNIQDPEQLILDTPMRTYGPQDPFRSGDTGDRIAVFTTLFFADPTLRTDLGHGQQVLPIGKAS